MLSDNLKLLLSGLAVVGAIALFYTLGDSSALVRALIVVAGVIAAAGIALTSEPGRAVWQFTLATRTEVRKVVWPTRMETTQTFMIVFGSIVVLCLFFWGLESLLSFLTSLVLG